jgi:transcription antitermination factor NusB
MTMTVVTEDGAVTVTDAALTHIVAQAAETVDGARVRRPRRHVVIEIGDTGARVQVGLAVDYGRVLPEYARGVTDAVVRDVADLDRRITDAAAESGWTADRLGAVERNILRIAIHELDVGDIPASAVIDEAVTLAKQYSTREAGRLVNGILDRIYREAA